MTYETTLELFRTTRVERRVGYYITDDMQRYAIGEYADRRVLQCLATSRQTYIYDASVNQIRVTYKTTPEEIEDCVHTDVWQAIRQDGTRGPIFATLSQASRWLYFNYVKSLLQSGRCECCNADTDTTELNDFVDEDRFSYNIMLCDDCREDEYESVNVAEYWQSPRFALAHQDDLVTCDSCDDRVLIATVTEVYNYDVQEHWCGSCTSNDSVYTEDTNRHVPTSQSFYHDQDECYYEDEDNLPRNILLSYSTNVLYHLGNVAVTKSRTVALRNANHLLLLGVELETDCRRGYVAEDVAERLIDDTDFESFGICKTDATCSGPEIVTLPATLDGHKHRISWEEYCETLRPIAKGHYGRDNGIHIHISKACLSPTTQAKMLVFMNNIKHMDFLSMIAQRDLSNNQWCSQTSHSAYKKVGKAWADPLCEKYTILNNTANTLECRMFKASLVHERIYKNLEFCDALVQFCRQASIQHLDSGANLVPTFKQFVQSNKHEYNHLSQFINQRSEA